MPAAVKDSRSYRCKDNSVIYVDFLADDVSANLRTARDAPPVALKAAAPGDPFKSGDYELVGSGTSVTATVPGKDTQSCTAYRPASAITDKRDGSDGFRPFSIWANGNAWGKSSIAPPN